MNLSLSLSLTSVATMGKGDAPPAGYFALTNKVGTLRLTNKDGSVRLLGKVT